MRLLSRSGLLIIFLASLGLNGYFLYNSRQAAGFTLAPDWLR